MKKRILIVFHQNEELSNLSYTINILKQEWNLSEFEVEAAYGIKHYIPADIAINHVDLTVTPDSYLDYLKKYPVVINGKVRNISKTFISKQRLNSDDDYKGKVIIKTDANCGGIPEFTLTGKGTRTINKVATKLSWWSKVLVIKSDDYPILGSIRSVPSGVWENKRLIVEKFLTEQDKEGNYCLRVWSFLGDRSLHVLTTSNHPIVKGNRILKREILSDHVPDALISFRNQLGVD
jgi:hypothetical protein